MRGIRDWYPFSMGAILKQIQEAVRNQGMPEIGTSLTRSRTGRITESFTAEQQLCELLVGQWLDDTLNDSRSWGRRLVKELLAELPRCGAPQAYRARGFPQMTHPKNPLCFGPPPTVTEGRYNRAGQTALYLGMSTQGLSIEMARYAKPDQRFYFARYHQTPSLALVDLSDTNVYAALHHAFDRAERLDEHLEAARRLADVVRELCIDGIVVPGVRGTKTYNYRNIVIFNCNDWAKWVDTGCAPELLATS